MKIIMLFINWHEKGRALLIHRYSARLSNGLSAVLWSVRPLCQSLINGKTILKIERQKLAHAKNSERQENPNLWAES